MITLQQIPLYLEVYDAGPADWALLAFLAVLLVWAALSWLAGSGVGVSAGGGE